MKTVEITYQMKCNIKFNPYGGPSIIIRNDNNNNNNNNDNNK